VVAVYERLFTTEAQRTLMLHEQTTWLLATDAV